MTLISCKIDSFFAYLNTITFNEFGVPEFTLSSSNNSFCGVFAVSDQITFTDISTGDVVSFEWDLGDGSPPISNIETISHIYDVIGTYTVSLTTEDLYGCLETFSQIVDIFFSDYYIGWRGGGIYNNLFELYNPKEDTIDLADYVIPVSYTHLTLPTKRIV